MSNINAKAEQFSPLSLSVGDILTNGDPIYQIPDYQRMYSWKDEEVSQLWDDIYEAYKNNEEDEEIDSNYFLGSLIVIQKELAEDVVDGQQRLTTLMILLCVMRQLYPNINKKVDATQNPKGKKSGEKAGKITVYQSTQKIINDYKGKVYKQKWNEEAVQDRYNWLCEEIGEILDIDVSSILYE